MVPLPRMYLLYVSAFPSVPASASSVDNLNAPTSLQNVPEIPEPGLFAPQLARLGP